MRDRLGSLLLPLRANMSVLLAKRRFAIYFMLRAAVLLPFLRECDCGAFDQRFDIAGHPTTSVACYLAA